MSKTGTGVDNIDVAAATANGTTVCNVVGYGTEVVSDHALALTLAVLRRINEIDADMRAGVWDFHRRRPLGQVHGRTCLLYTSGHMGQSQMEKVDSALAVSLGIKGARDGFMLLTLCRKCHQALCDSGDYLVYRSDFRQKEREPCTICNTCLLYTSRCV